VLAKDYLLEHGTKLEEATSYHVLRLQALQHRSDLLTDCAPWPYTYEQLCILKNMGYRWFVGKTFVKCFRYAASFDWRNSFVSTRDGSWRGDAAVYAGDVPAPILDRVESIQQLPLRYPTVFEGERAECWRFAVLSCKPLPVKLVKVDPVLICAPFRCIDHPWIVVNGSGQIQEVQNLDWCEHGLAFVVGMWNQHDEIEAL